MSTQKTPSTFHRWLKMQEERHDAVGDLARDTGRDNCVPKGKAVYDTWWEYLCSVNACEGAKQALERAFGEYQFAFKMRERKITRGDFADVWSLDELMNLRIDYDDLSISEQGREQSYRKGFYHGVDTILDLLKAGTARRRLEFWREWALFDWTFGKNRHDNLSEGPPDVPLTQKQWLEQRKFILERDNHRCQYCGKPATHVDHIIPKSRGGSDNLSNLVAACAKCNLNKRDKLLEEWEGPQ